MFFKKISKIDKSLVESSRYKKRRFTSTKLEIKKYRLHQTMQKFKGLEETIMAIKCITWKKGKIFQFTSVQLLIHVQFFVTPWTATCQASLSITNPQSLPKLMSIESGMQSNHLILCRSFHLLPSIFPIIRYFSNESVLFIRSQSIRVSDAI